jgi:hypothetical protein
MNDQSRQIQVCDKIASECWRLFSIGVEVNQLIVRHKLMLPPLDLHAVHTTMQAAEQMLKNLELKADAKRVAAEHIARTMTDGPT